MGSLVLGGFDVVGDGDEGGDDFAVLGAGPIARTGGLHRAGGAHRVPTPRWMNATTSQGVSRPQEEMDFLPFDPLTIANGDQAGVLISEPQRPFRGERLILGAVDGTTGADVAANATINPAMYVGAVQVGTAQGATPFLAFSANAFGVRLSLPSAGQGTKIKIYTQLLAASANDTLCTGTLIGRAMR